MTTLNHAQIAIALRNRAIIEDLEVLDTHNPESDDARGLAATIRDRIAALDSVPPVISEALGRIRPDCRALVIPDSDDSDNLDLDGAIMILAALGIDHEKTDCGTGLEIECRCGAELLIYEDPYAGGDLAWRRTTLDEDGYPEDESGPIDTSTELVALLVGLGLGRTR